MLKSLVFALVPACLMASAALADDDFFAEVSNLDVSSLTDTDIAMEDVNFDDLDVDALANQAGEESDEAIEACFRRCYGGFRGYGYGYRHFNHYNYYNHYNYCQPTYFVHRPVYTYTTYTTYSPIYSYWGCY